MPIWMIAVYIVFSVLCIFSAVKLNKDAKKQYMKSVLAAYAIYSIVFFAVWIFKLAVPPYALLLTMLTVLAACLLGYLAEFYIKSKTFDRYLHAFGAFSFSLLTYFIICNFAVPGGSQMFRALFVFLIGSTLGNIFEATEACSDAKNKRQKDHVSNQRGLKDTNMDMLFNLAGSALAGVFSYFLML